MNVVVNEIQVLNKQSNYYAHVKGRLPMGHTLGSISTQWNKYTFEISISSTPPPPGTFSAAVVKNFSKTIPIGGLNKSGKYAIRINGDNDAVKWFQIHS